VVGNPARISICGSSWDFVPFTHNPIEALEELRAMPGNPEYALGHIALDGAMLHGSQQSDVSIEHDGDMVRVSPSIFGNYRHTYLGHYHAEQRVNQKVEYIGSPLELSFGEAFQEKHLIIHDCESGDRRYVINNFSPKHLIVKAEDRSKYDLEGNFVQIKVDEMSATDLLTMKRELQTESNAASIEIKQQKRVIEEHVIRDAKAILNQGDILNFLNLNTSINITKFDVRDIFVKNKIEYKPYKLSGILKKGDEFFKDFLTKRTGKDNLDSLTARERFNVIQSIKNFDE
jgi:hypothetical protein